MMALDLDQCRKLLAKGEKGDTRSLAKVIRALLDGDLDPDPDGDKGDITVSADGATLTIDNGAVTLAKIASGVVRERLTANRTYYIRADGSDANTGLVNSAGGAWATRQHAWDTIHDTLDLNGFVVTVQIADSTAYTDELVAEGWCVGQDSSESIVFQGNNGTPANVRINVTSGQCFSAEHGAQFVVKDMELRTTTTGNCLQAIGYGSRINFGNIRFGACGTNHISAFIGADIGLISGSNYAIVGGADRHFNAENNATIFVAFATITITGTPAFTAEFARADWLGAIMAHVNTFSGGATGKRYESNKNGVIYTAAGGANYFPGDAAGSTADGGIYV